MGWGWHSASEHSIHSVVATAGHRTAAESERERERDSTPSPGLGMFGVWRPGRVSGPSTASAGAGDRRLLRGWGWPGTGHCGPGWPAVTPLQ